MTNSHAGTLFAVAERLDEFPEEFVNGGATDALAALAASKDERDAIAASRGIDESVVSSLWERAGALLRESPERTGNLYRAAADAATLLYGAAWVLGSEDAKTEDLSALM
jgi:hypothetical protein